MIRFIQTVQCWDQHLLNNGCGTIPVQMIELHQVVDRQRDCFSDSLTKF